MREVVLGVSLVFLVLFLFCLPGLVAVGLAMGHGLEVPW